MRRMTADYEFAAFYFEFDYKGRCTGQVAPLLWDRKHWSYCGSSVGARFDCENRC